MPVLYFYYQLIILLKMVERNTMTMAVMRDGINIMRMNTMKKGSAIHGTNTKMNIGGANVRTIIEKLDLEIITIIFIEVNFMREDLKVM